MSKIGVIHYNLRDLSFDQFLAYAAETGFGYVELQRPDVWGDDVEDPVKNAEDVRKKVDAAGLEVSALAAQNDFVVLDPDVVSDQVARMKTICECAQALGANVMATKIQQAIRMLNTSRMPAYVQPPRKSFICPKISSLTITKYGSQGTKCDENHSVWLRVTSNRTR